MWLGNIYRKKIQSFWNDNLFSCYLVFAMSLSRHYSRFTRSLWKFSTKKPHVAAKKKMSMLQKICLNREQKCDVCYLTIGQLVVVNRWMNNVNSYVPKIALKMNRRLLITSTSSKEYEHIDSTFVRQMISWFHYGLK